MIKSTAIDPSVVDADGVYRKTGPARVFRTEAAAIAAIKSHGPERVQPGDVIVLICRGPMGSGMEETYQITSALKLPGFRQARRRAHGRAFQRRFHRRLHRAYLARSAGRRAHRQSAGWRRDRNRRGPRQPGRIREPGRAGADLFGAAEGARVLAARPMRPDLAADPALPPETRLWAALQRVSGGTWGGCVYDPDAILKAWAVNQRGYQIGY